MPASFKCYQEIQKIFKEKEIQEKKEKNFQDYLKGLEEALRSIANGDILTSREKAKMALEGTFPVANTPATSEENLFKQRNNHFYFKGYWYQEYLEMREKYYKQMGENSQQAERIKDLTFLVTELQPNRDYADRIRELEEQLKAKQGENHELYAMLGHIVDWSPELPYYMKDEYKTLFKNALAAARELLSKCRVKEGK